MTLTNTQKDFLAEVFREQMDTADFIPTLTKDGEYTFLAGTVGTEPYKDKGDRRVTRMYQVTIAVRDEDWELTKEDKNEILQKFTPDVIGQTVQAVDEAEE